MTKTDFDPAWLSQNDLNWDAVYALALACEAAYRPDYTAFVTDVWEADVTDVSGQDTEGFLAEFDDVAVLAFRGTQQPRDWIANLDLWPQRFAPLDGRVHGGFAKAWDHVAAVVMPALERLDGKRLWITGHSLGGAVALLAAATHHDKTVGLVTFGQPRMLKRKANEKANAIFNTRYTRLVHGNDIVPKVPPNFGHTGQLSHFDTFGDQINSGGSLETMGGFDQDGPLPMSEEEFAAYQNSLKENETVLEGDATGIPAHRISAYVALAKLKRS